MAKKNKNITRLILALMLGMFLTVSYGTLNQAVALEYNGPSGTVSCDISDESLVVKVVYCVKMAVFTATEAFLAQTTAMMEFVVYTVLLLGMVMLGVRIATGERDPQKMVMSYLLRFGVILLIANNYGDGFDGTIDGNGLTDETFMMMEELQASVIPALYITSDTCDINSTEATALPTGGYIIPITYTPWQYIDCIFDYIFGFGVDATIASSIFGFIGSAFFSGSMGSMIFFLGFAVVMSLAFFAFRVVYIVLLAYIYTGFLIVLAPLIAPFLMFKMFERNFYKWIFDVLSGLVQPFIMVAYLAFALPILDTFVFGDGETSLANTLGRGEEITERYRLAEPVCQMESASDFEFFSDVENYQGRIQQDLLNPMDSGAMDWCGMFDFTKVDLGEEHIQELWGIGLSLIKILGVSYLITSVAKLIPQLTSKLVGGGYSFGRAATSPMLFETAIRGGLNGLSTRMAQPTTAAISGGNSNIASLLGLRR